MDYWLYNDMIWDLFVCGRMEEGMIKRLVSSFSTSVIKQYWRSVCAVHLNWFSLQWLFLLFIKAPFQNPQKHILNLI